MYAISRRKHFRTLLANLWSVNAHPDAVDLGPCVPEGHILLQVAGARQHRTCDDPVNVDFAALDVFKNAVVRCRFAPDIVIFRQPVHRHRDPKTRDFHPLDRDRDHSAGDDECEYAQLTESGKNAAEFTMPNQRLSAHQRNMHGLVLSHQV